MVIVIEENKDIDSMKIDELVGFIQTYKINLPNSQRHKEFAFKAFENEEN